MPIVNLDHPGANFEPKLTLAVTADRIIAGTNPQIAIKEHIDEWNRHFDAGIYEDEPALTGIAHLDAWLAGAAHYEAFMLDQEPPPWVDTPVRFLKEPYFVGGRNMQALALVETPFAFRMRMVFTGQSTIKAPQK